MRINFNQLVVGMVLLAGLQRALGQLDGLDDRYRTEDTFRDTDNSVKQAFQAFDATKTGTNKVYNGKVSFTEVNLPIPKQGWILTFSAQPKVGFESNPLHAQSAKGSLLYGIDGTFGLTYTTNTFSVSLFQYTVKSVFYDDNQLANGTSTRNADSIQNKLSPFVLSYRFTTNNYVLKLTPTISDTIVNEKHSSESAGLSPSFAFKWPGNGLAATALGYTYNRFHDMTTQTNSALFDQANEHTLSLDNSFFTKVFAPSITDGLSSVTFGYAHKWHDPNGLLRQYQSDTAYIEFSGPFFIPLTKYDITYSHGWKTFAAPGSASTGITRIDGSDDVTFILDGKLLDHDADPKQALKINLDVIVSYEYGSNDSNKSTVKYNDNTFFAGIKFGY